MNFPVFDIRNFRFTAVYDSILFSSPLVQLSNHDFRGFASAVFLLYPHINSLNQEMPVFDSFLAAGWSGQSVK